MVREASGKVWNKQESKLRSPLPFLVSAQFIDEIRDRVRCCCKKEGHGADLPNIVMIMVRGGTFSGSHGG